MRFFNLDVHISVIADITAILEELGHEVTSWNLSNHTWVFDKEPDKVEVVNQNTWKHIDPEVCDQFYRRYKTFLSTFDAFITTYPPCFSLLFQNFGKPIIVVSATRYEFPFTNSRIRWTAFNNYLASGIDAGFIIPIANNKYDSEYCEYFTKRKWSVIPSLCEYTNSKYSGIRNKFPYYSKLKRRNWFGRLVNIDRALGKRYCWQDIADFKGVVHIPYNASTMSIFEQYTANIPLFFPTFEFLNDLRKKHGHEGVLSELSFNQVLNISEGSVIGSSDSRDPNLYTNTDVMMEWMRLADYYDIVSMPHITYFESFSHLKKLLRTVDLKQISRAMAEANIDRRETIIACWRDVVRMLKESI